MPTTRQRTLHEFRLEADRLWQTHPVVTDNAYTRWFSSGQADREDVRHLTVQFSVFSHQFVEAQLRKVINAPTLEAAREGKEILLNELGVPFHPPEASATEPLGSGDDADPTLVGTEGTVEGSRFRFAAGHFEWLVRFAQPLDLGFESLGKRRHGTASTLHFCDELLRLYGSEDPVVGAGASYAVEHWAAAGFWKELIAGLGAFKERECPRLHLGFWVWHDRLEDQHAEHTADELAEVFEHPSFDAHHFLGAESEMLDAVHVFWSGLDRDRLAMEDD